MSITSINTAEFREKGYLHLHSFVDPINCQRLIVRMRELTDRNCRDDKEHVFEAGAVNHTKDEFFLSSANKIAFFYDKNSERRSLRGKSNFFALNKVGHALHSCCPVFKIFSPGINSTNSLKRLDRRNHY